MEIVAVSGDLKKEIDLLHAAADCKGLNPILGYTRIEAVDGTLRLSSTDTEVAVHCRATARVAQDGAVLLKVDRLRDLLRTLPDDIDVQITHRDAGHVNVIAAAYRGEWMSPSVDEYPSLDQMPEAVIHLSRRNLVGALMRVRFATLDKDPRFFLNGSQMQLEHGEARLTTTDGHRLATAWFSVDDETAQEDVILPKKMMNDLASMLTESEAETVSFSRGEHHLFFSCDDRVMASRMVDAKFPDWRRVLPKGKKQVVAEFDRDALTSSIRRVALMNDMATKSVQFDLGADACRVSAVGADIGSADESIAASIAGSDIGLKLSANYVLDFLDVAETARVKVEIENADNAVIYHPVQTDETSTQFLCVIMPLRM